MNLKFTFRGFKQFFKRSGISLNDLGEHMKNNFSFDTITDLWIAGRYSEKQLTEEEADTEIEEYLSEHSLAELNEYIMNALSDSGLFSENSNKKKSQK